jgi:hypothetical protein
MDVRGGGGDHRVVMLSGVGFKEEQLHSFVTST